ncbi:Gfo/Idh/MocA family protein [Marinoscillum furvescens]|uniref:Putative dehydrogenase n=1 Tax=Marinoscillum furvescens DSM 4134 TaxID=1122208 RepID=A0A3D9L3W3_MARFU|nr:Gfo/Idh/MocA family oxidoreductase [Marinoscillum furvescens]RED97983.1 putative dehydrogenase [Marinoscillum furvescens DSM 4134]
MQKLNWGILSTAKIAVEKVIPGLLKSDDLAVRAIASRNLEKAGKVAEELNIPVAYDSYEALLSDPEIDVIYNPLPNHLHVEWTAKAIEAGKHVLCEKPLLLTVQDAEHLIKLRNKYNVKVGEAFMVKSHPQWQRAKAIIDSGLLGGIRLYQGTFSYFNADPQNIRNIANYGGGAMWDIGCYPVMTSRYLFGESPTRVIASLQIDEQFGTDVLSTVQMEFSSGIKAQFAVSTQAAAYQRVHVLGTEKELEIMIPFNAPTDQPTVLRVNSADILRKNEVEELLPPSDQYQLQAEDFCRAILENTSEPVTLEDARDHCRIIEAIFESNKKGTWINIQVP